MLPWFPPRHCLVEVIASDHRSAGFSIIELFNSPFFKLIKLYHSLKKRSAHWIYGNVPMPFVGVFHTQFTTCVQSFSPHLIGTLHRALQGRTPQTI